MLTTLSICVAPMLSALYADPLIEDIKTVTSSLLDEHEYWVDNETQVWPPRPTP
jgi:hypothetical protein